MPIIHRKRFLTMHQHVQTPKHSLAFQSYLWWNNSVSRLIKKRVVEKKRKKTNLRHTLYSLQQRAHVHLVCHFQFSNHSISMIIVKLKKLELKKLVKPNNIQPFHDIKYFDIYINLAQWFPTCAPWPLLSLSISMIFHARYLRRYFI